jgi:hypothetical protein
VKLSVPFEFWGAHAARVLVSAAGRDAPQDPLANWTCLQRSEVSGGPPETARQRRALPNPLRRTAIT